MIKKSSSKLIQQPVPTHCLIPRYGSAVIIFPTTSNSGIFGEEHAYAAETVGIHFGQIAILTRNATLRYNGLV